MSFSAQIRKLRMQASKTAWFAAVSATQYIRPRTQQYMRLAAGPAPAQAQRTVEVRHAAGVQGVEPRAALLLQGGAQPRGRARPLRPRQAAQPAAWHTR